MIRKSTHLVSGFVLTIALVTAGFSQSIKRPVLEDGGEGEEFQERRQRHEEMRLIDPKTGKIPTDIRKKELEFVRSLGANLQSSMRPKQSRAAGVNVPTAVGDPQTNFISRGPYNVGGRTRAFAIDINNENHLLAGGVSGGMWSSDDGGVTWTRRTALNDLASVTAIVQDKRPGFQSTWYYSTGEFIGNSASGNGDGQFGASYLGDGIFKSTDNGLTWIPIYQIGSPQIFIARMQYISSLAIDNQGNILAGAFRGIYRSTDGGTTFSRVYSPTSTYSYSCEVYISQSNVYYITIQNDGIYRSTSGTTDSWTKISLASFPAFFGRTVVYSAPSDPTILYCLVSETTSSTSNDLWKYQYLSGDGSGSGGTWTNLTAQLPTFVLLEIRDSLHKEVTI